MCESIAILIVKCAKIYKYADMAIKQDLLEQVSVFLALLRYEGGFVCPVSISMDVNFVISLFMSFTFAIVKGYKALSCWPSLLKMTSL